MINDDDDDNDNVDYNDDYDDADDDRGVSASKLSTPSFLS